MPGQASIAVLDPSFHCPLASLAMNSCCSLNLECPLKAHVMKGLPLLWWWLGGRLGDRQWEIIKALMGHAPEGYVGT